MKERIVTVCEARYIMSLNEEKMKIITERMTRYSIIMSLNERKSQILQRKVF